MELRLPISWQERESVLESPGVPGSLRRPLKVEEEGRRGSERFSQRRKQREVENMKSSRAIAGLEDRKGPQAKE